MPTDTPPPTSPKPAHEVEYRPQFTEASIWRRSDYWMGIDPPPSFVLSGVRYFSTGNTRPLSLDALLVPPPGLEEATRALAEWDRDLAAYYGDVDRVGPGPEARHLRTALAHVAEQRSRLAELREERDRWEDRVTALRTEIEGVRRERDEVARNADRIFCAACERLDAHEAPGVTLSERIDGLAAERDLARSALAAGVERDATYRHALAWAIVHADRKAAWQLEVYAVVGGLALKREDDAELSAAYETIAMSGPCNWNWHPSARDPKTLALLGREPAPGERVVDTLNAWIRVPAAEWPAVLPAPVREEPTT